MRIGFLSTEFNARESDGEIALTFGVLEGMVTSDVQVQFYTTDGSATSKTINVTFSVWGHMCKTCP